jgi:hypothetical protein
MDTTLSTKSDNLPAALRRIAINYGGDCRSTLLRAALKIEREDIRVRSLRAWLLLAVTLLPWAAIAGLVLGL